MFGVMYCENCLPEKFPAINVSHTEVAELDHVHEGQFAQSRVPLPALTVSGGTARIGTYADPAYLSLGKEIDKNLFQLRKFQREHNDDN